MTTLWQGAPASPEQLAFLAFHSYGHYTFFQVRRKSVRGLALHLERLRSNALELFGSAPAEGELRELLAQVPENDCSVRVTVVSEDLEGLLAGRAVEPVVVVSTTEPRPPQTAPMTVRSVRYARETPWIKHRATYGPVRETRAARQAGFDDAVFVDTEGHLSEGTTWNLLLHHDGGWVWPQAALLDGVTQQLLRSALTQAGIPQRTTAVTLPDLPGYDAGFALNASSHARPLASVDARAFPSGAAAAVQLEELWAAIVPEPL